MTAVMKLLTPPRYRIVTNESERVANWVGERLGGRHISDASQAIGHERDGELIAGVLYDGYNGRSICMHVAGEGKRWITRMFLFACFDYPFNVVGVHKIIGLVDESNSDARRLDEHLGFVHEATITQASPGGDLLVYSMTREQCRFLGERYGRQIK